MLINLTRKTSIVLILAILIASLAWSGIAPVAAQAPEAPPPESPPAAAVAPPKKAYSEEAIKHYNKGVELHQSGFLNQAIAEYRGAIESDERMEEAWSNLGGIYAAQRSYTKALEAFQKALTLKPDRPTTLNGLGTVLYAKGRIDEAKEKWRQAIQADPKFASAYYNMANALENEKKISEAVNEYVKAITVNPSMGDSFYRIATIYLKEQHAAQARVMFAKAVALGPDAEYIRDAKKQLASLDAGFATDLMDRREGREVKMESQPGTRDGGVNANARPKSDAPKTTTADTPKARTKPVKQTATETPPSAPKAPAAPSGINITTDENGRGTVVEKPIEKPARKKKKEKVRAEDVAKTQPTTKPEETVTTTAPTPGAAPESTTPATDNATNIAPSATPEETPTKVVTQKTKKKKKEKMRLEDVAKTAPSPSDEKPAAAAAPADDNSAAAATRTPENMPPQDLVPTPDNLPTKDTVATPDTTPASPVTPEAEPKGTEAANLSGMTDDAPKKKTKKRKKSHEDLARTFIVPPQETPADATPGTAPPVDSTNAAPAAPPEDAATPAMASPAASATPDSSTSSTSSTPSAPVTKKKKSHHKHESADENTIFKTIDSNASDVSDLKERPTTSSPAQTTTPSETDPTADPTPMQN